MSDAHHKQFEIDLDEIERQLRRSVNLPVEPPPPPAGEAKADPLAELARIVGQNDPFAGILGDARTSVRAGAAEAGGRAEPLQAPPVVLSAEERGVLGRGDPTDDDETGEPLGARYYDPVVEAYGSVDNAIETEDFQPLPPRRARRRVAAILMFFLVAVAGATGAILWRNGFGGLTLSGPPPLITADKAPLKVPPQDPGGMEIPNQDRQIYQRGAPDASSRVLDTQEQPMDLRAATRTGPGGDTPAGEPRETGRSGLPSYAAAGQQSAASSAVASALGEARRVRTVAVRPDGTTVVPSGSAIGPDPSPMIMPGGAPPPPVSVSTLSIPPAAALGLGSPASVDAAPRGPTVSVLPPSRPGVRPAAAAGTPSASEPAASEPFFRPGVVGRTDGGETPAPDAIPNQTGAIQVRPPVRPARTGSTGSIGTTPIIADVAGAGGRGFAVQIATRSTEGEARAAYAQLSERHATDLGGRPSSVVPAEVGGRSVYRVRVGPMSRDDANTLCTRLKTSGGACFVAAN